MPTKSSIIDSSGVHSNSSFGLQDIINKAVKDLDVPRADETDGKDITAELDKRSLPVLGPGFAARGSAQSLLVSSRSTTPSLPSRTPSPWTDDDLPQVLPNLPKSLPDLPKVFRTTVLMQQPTFYLF